MFKRFMEQFEVTEKGLPNQQPPPVDLPAFVNGNKSFQRLMSEFGGCEFNQGLYRLHDWQNLGRWNEIVGDAFPEFRSRICCFGYDWLGRHFALDEARTSGGENQILMLEPGTAQVLEIPASFLGFHEEELVEHREEALASDFLEKWRLNSRRTGPSLDQCVGYRIPLFLGGEDKVKNLDLIDMEVYWVITGQLICKSRFLPPGTAIHSVRLIE